MITRTDNVVNRTIQQSTTATADESLNFRALWRHTRLRLRRHYVRHKSEVLPCDVRELRWIRFQIKRVIAIFDEAYWQLLGISQRLALTISGTGENISAAERGTGLPQSFDRRSRLDALLPFLSDEEWCDLTICQRLMAAACRQLAQWNKEGTACAKTMHSALNPNTLIGIQEHAQQLAVTFRALANMIRVGTISPLAELEQRVVILLDALDQSPNEHPSGERRRGRRVNPANEARDRRLRQLCEHLEDEGAATPKRLQDVADGDLLIQLLVQRFQVRVSYEVCRNIISPVRHRRARRA